MTSKYAVIETTRPKVGTIEFEDIRVGMLIERERRGAGNFHVRGVVTDIQGLELFMSDGYVNVSPREVHAHADEADTESFTNYGPGAENPCTYRLCG